MSTATVTAAPTTRPRAARWALGVLQVLLAAVYLFSAAGKISLEPTVVAGFAMMGIGAAGTVALGVVELAAAIGLLVPRLAGLAATGCVALMTGAVIITAITVGGAMILVPAVVLVLVAVVAWVRRHETVALLRNPRAVLFAR
ncbi:DoxX family protein [Actinomycetospora straminea]|uniref:DoxX-like protein n=1 Tax=Actinomycetospora straminea TaxID=663607 RepID=A0ABP9E140_9PSEU|nr:DoxX family protein [Actinomycetospora straminea]MDD7931169.1 DoxX family protein [Actinomycetospora straminea]